MNVDKSKISKATLSRLPYYFQFLMDPSVHEQLFISATRIAKELDMGEVLVRKDLNIVCGMGKPKRGYRTEELIDSIKECLGYGNATSAVLVGAGKLGRALLDYDELSRYGVRILAAFDCNEKSLRLGSSLEILPMTEFSAFCRSHNIKIGIITVGTGSAQIVCDQMVESGIKAIWNFAPCTLKIPDGILLLQENLALSLAYLNTQLLDQKQKENAYTI